MLAQNENLVEESAQIRRFFDSQNEWLLQIGATENFTLQSAEIEITAQNNKLILSCVTARGWRSWRVTEWNADEQKLRCQTMRSLQNPAQNLEFVPRVAFADLRAELKIARLVKAREIAETARRTFSQFAKIERVSLSQSNRRGKLSSTARILLSLANAETVAVCASVADKIRLESLLSNAILWTTKLTEKRKIAEIWLIVAENQTLDLCRLRALLRDGWKNKIKILSYRADEENAQLIIAEPFETGDLWREKVRKIFRAVNPNLSEWTRQIVALAPAEIDFMPTKSGETLRFNGLPFVRVRRIMDEEKSWFGLYAKHRRILDENSWTEFEILLANLRENRRADADKQNKIYRRNPEAWLEAILRRDVSRLDPNLILAPLYAQFRAANAPGSLDLLALRNDGRLVVIELKTTVDREHIFQAVNYWRQIEQQRRAENLNRFFADLPILDAPPLIYLVAPLMSFHRDFEILARAVAPDIEMWRFDLNEDWRAGIRVSRRLECKF